MKNVSYLRKLKSHTYIDMQSIEEKKALKKNRGNLRPDQMFNKNPNLRAANVTMAYTKAQFAEIVRCYNNPLYFINNYCYIIALGKGLVKFNTRDYQDETIRLMHEHSRVIMKFPRQSGKLLDNRTPINTKVGWSTVGELKVGDVVYGPDGKETNITFITETTYNKKTYELTFDNGEKIVACADHLWEVNHSDWDKKNKIMTTSEMLKKHDRVMKIKKPNTLYINGTNPLEYNEKDLRLDPYYLGFWLGDGDSNAPVLTSSIYDYEEVLSHIPYNISTATPDKRSNAIRLYFRGLVPKFKSYGLKNNKHIPYDYKRSSIDQRLELIRGMMDSDGNAEKIKGSCEFYNKNKTLIDDFREVLSSLGIKNRLRVRDNVRGHEGEIHYTVSFATSEFDLFKLKRKLNYQKKTKGHPKNKRFHIHSIVEVDSVPMRCLQVDNNDHMFLVGKTMVPTHNTTGTVGYVCWEAIFRPNSSIAILANKEKTSKGILQKAKLIYECLPVWLQAGVVEWNKNSIILDNGSKVGASATSSSGIRSESISTLIIDECVDGGTILTIRRNGRIENIAIEDLYHRLILTNKDIDGRVIHNTDYEVLTYDGWSNFSGIRTNIHDMVLEIKTNEKSLICSMEHKIEINGELKMAKDIVNGDMTGRESILSVEKIAGVRKLFDLVEVSNNNKYVTNGIESSNCAFVQHNIWEEFYSSVYPTVSASKTSKIILISCVTKDTLINTSEGILPIGDFVQMDEEGSYFIDRYSLYGRGGQENSGKLMVNSGISKTRKILTSFGLLEGSLEHKLWSMKDTQSPGWSKIGDLSEGDFISIDYGHKKFADNDLIEDVEIAELLRDGRNYDFGNKITPDMAYFFGQLIGDGYTRKKGYMNQVVISSEDDISFMFDDIGVSFTKHDDIHFCVNSKRLVSLIEGVGFDINKKSKEKTIPKRLMGMSEENIKALLSGLFDADGCAHGDNGSKGTISIGLTSKKLIEQVKALLANIGILCHYSEKYVEPTKKVKASSYLYMLELGKNDSKKFYDEIGFRLKRKQDKESKLNFGKKNRNKEDIIPYSKRDIRIMREKFPELKKIIKMNGVHKSGFHFNRETMLSFKADLEAVSYLGISEVKRYFENVDEHLRWVKIKKIECGEEEVFDFSLDEIDGDRWCHSVTYNSYLGHQTPFGLNHFHAFWQEANDPNSNSDFVPYEIKWDDVPGRDEKFKQKVIDELGLEFWNQEFCCVADATEVEVYDVYEKKYKKIPIGQLFEEI